MRLVWLCVLAALIGAVPAHAVRAADDARSQAVERLLRQIHMGESLYRDDLVMDAIQRLYRVAPRHPEGLLAEMRLAIHRQQLEQAQGLLGELERSAPGSRAYRQGAALLRLSTPPATDTLARARLYAAAGRIDEARKAYDEAFQGEYPSADLALEYWQLRAREPASRALALNELKSLLAAYPSHAGLLSALANHSFNEGHPSEALAYLHKLARQPAHREAAANREFDYLSTLDTSAQSVAQWQSFVQRYEALPVGQRAKTKLDQQAGLMADPVWRGGREALLLVERGGAAGAVDRLRAAIQAYPDDAELYGALGLATMRLGNRAGALRYFEQAKAKEHRVDQTSKWVSLIESTRYWLLLQDAAKAGERGDWAKAHALYRNAHQQNPGDIHALVGLGDAALALGQRDAAKSHYSRALALAPADESAQRGIARYLAGVGPQQALSFIDALPATQSGRLAPLRRNYQIALLDERAAQAQARSDWNGAVAALTEAQQLNLADPWLSYRLATAMRAAGREADALTAYERHLQMHQTQPASRYAHGLLLESQDQWQAARDSLREIPAGQWSQDMKELDRRLRLRQRIAHAEALYAAGSPAAAIAALEAPEQSTATRLQVASWSLEQGDHAKALANYAAVLRDEPDNTSARLGQLETWVAQGKTAMVRQALLDHEPVLSRDDLNGRRRLAALWADAGDKSRQRSILREAAAGVQAPAALLFRDYARATASENPHEALNLYERAMRDAGMLPPRPATGLRDDVAFTRAMRSRMEDDWLQRSLRSDAMSLYQRENPTLTLSDDFWGRNDGTPGLSRLAANTGIMQFDYPMLGGKAFIRGEHVSLDAGSFDTDDAGQHVELFGTCAFEARDAQGDLQSLPGCQDGSRQKARGTGVAIGWQGERLSFDLGRTPQGFPVSNWAGGITYRGDIRSVGWSLTASRRPMSNSLLSYAGTQDPRTGIVWGGVMASGMSLGLSWDQGEADGVWADLSHHRLTGKNVADNHRTRIMAGYYRRLINRPHESLTVGVNAMHWRYQKDLGEYTLGHGGYYSPRRYSSVSLPISYARRNAHWAFVLEASVSKSVSRVGDTDYYPLQELVAGPMRAMNDLGVSNSALFAANAVPGSSGGGVGYSVRGLAERRLDNHWVVGGGFDLQRGKDYTPSRFMLYLRYTFEPWQGDLTLRPAALTPYADFK